MGNMLRSVLSAIVATHKRYDAERKVSDRLVAELSAIAEDMKQAREARETRERSETRRSACSAAAQSGGSAGRALVISVRPATSQDRCKIAKVASRSAHARPRAIVSGRR